jgi:hypothetical protein
VIAQNMTDFTLNVAVVGESHARDYHAIKHALSLIGVTPRLPSSSLLCATPTL